MNAKMLEIRKDVMWTFRRSQLEPAAKRLSYQVRRKLRDLVVDLSDQELTEFIERGAIKAEKYGLTSEYNVYRFLAALLVFGETFDNDFTNASWTKDFLFDPTIDQDHKARLLELRIAIDTSRSV